MPLHFVWDFYKRGLLIENGLAVRSSVNGGLQIWNIDLYEMLILDYVTENNENLNPRNIDGTLQLSPVTEWKLCNEW